MIRPRSIFVPLLMVGIGLFSLGTVVKKKGPIQLTQDEGVSVQEEMKEIKEGRKGPPAPTLQLFPKERFLVQVPVEKPKASVLIQPIEDSELWLEEEEPSEMEEFGEELLEDEEFKLEDETDDTWEDTPDSEEEFEGVKEQKRKGISHHNSKHSKEF